MSYMSMFISEHQAAGRTMDCELIKTAQAFEAEYQALRLPLLKAAKENQFTDTILAMPDWTPSISIAVLSHVFKEKELYTPAQKATLVAAHLGYIMREARADNKHITIAYLKNLLPTARRPVSRLDEFPALKAAIESKINESI